LAKQRVRELLAIERLLNGSPVHAKLNDIDFLQKKDLELHSEFGGTGMSVFCAALSHGALVSLDRLVLHCNAFGDEDMIEFSSVLSSGVLASLNTLIIGFQTFGLPPC
jgi:hypothetical protein